MSSAKKFIVERYLEEDAATGIGLLGLGTMAGLSLTFKFSSRKIKSFEKVKYEGCGRLLDKRRVLKCKIYFLKKKFNEESKKIYKRIEELDKFYEKHPSKDDEKHPDIIKYHKEWERLNNIWKELAKRCKNDILRMKREYEGNDD